MPPTPAEVARAVEAEACRRQLHPRGPQKMAEVVAGLLARRGYAQVQTASTCDKAWRDAAGPRFALHSRPGNVKRGVLEITVRNSAVIQELTFQKKQLLARIAALLPDQKIKDLKFKVGPVD